MQLIPTRRARRAPGPRVGKPSPWRAGLGLALASSTLALTATSALFTDAEAVGGNAFSTGTVDIGTDPASALVSFSSAMAPGDADLGTLTVSNPGSLELRYAVESTVVNGDSVDLAAQLDLTVWAESAETTVDGACAGVAPATVLYGPGDLGAASATTKLVGDKTTGSHTGDRTLAAGADEVLCFLVELPGTTGNTYAGKTTTATFAFEAEQTRNNA